MSSPTVEIDLVVFDSNGRVLLVRTSPNDDWATPCGNLLANEYVHTGSARIARDMLGIAFCPQRVLGCYQETGDGSSNVPGKIKFAVSTTLEGSSVRRINLHLSEGMNGETHWWEPATVLAARDVAPATKNFFTPSPWNKIL